MSDSVRDRIAELEGWAKHLANGATPADGEDGFYWMKGGRMQWDHPIPDTLDEAAKLPEGWAWKRCFDARGHEVWEAFRGQPCHVISIPDTGDIKTGLFTLRLAVLEHIAKENA